MVGPLLAPTIWGLFSRRVDIKAIWIPAGISFAIGMVVKVGLAPEGPLVAEGTEGVSEWIQANGTTVDLVIGIVVPIVVLFLLQYLAKSAADGWNRVDRLIQQTQDSGVERRASDLPAMIVSGSLAACAALMFALMVWNQKERALLGGFGVVLLVISGMIAGMLWSKRGNQRGRRGTRGIDPDRS